MSPHRITTTARIDDAGNLILPPDWTHLLEIEVEGIVEVFAAVYAANEERGVIRISSENRAFTFPAITFLG